MLGVGSPRPLRPGDPERLGRFDVIGRLGAGGMGVAYLARDETGNQAVVKTIQVDFADDSDSRRRFRREVLAASAIESTFVPEVLASDVSADRQWVAIEYIEGPTLAEMVVQQGPFGQNQQLALAAALADGLTQLHLNGLIHRDLKPSNIICTSRGPRLIDFGIAVMQQLSALTRTGGLAPGSPGWMAPEQLDPYSTPTPAIDVFAWGCVCWYAATGRSPFAGASAEDSISALRAWTSTHKTPPKSLHPTLRPLVVDALNPSPDERPAAPALAGSLGATFPGTTSEMVAATWDARATTPIATRTTPQVTSLDVATPPNRRRFRQTLLAASALSLVAAASVGIAWSVTSFRLSDISRGLNTGTPTSATDAAANPSPSVTTREPAAVDASEPASTEQSTSPPVAGSPDDAVSISDGQKLGRLPGYGGNRRVGYGSIKLGMTRAQLLATGETMPVQKATSGCTKYPMPSGGYAVFSENLGRVAYIEFANEMATSRGIKVGARWKDVRAAYPEASYSPDGLMTAPVVPPHVYYLFGGTDFFVTQVILLSDRQDCAG